MAQERAGRVAGTLQGCACSAAALGTSEHSREHANCFKAEWNTLGRFQEEEGWSRLPKHDTSDPTNSVVLHLHPCSLQQTDAMARLSSLVTLLIGLSVLAAQGVHSRMLLQEGCVVTSVVQATADASATQPCEGPGLVCGCVPHRGPCCHGTLCPLLHSASLPLLFSQTPQALFCPPCSGCQLGRSPGERCRMGCHVLRPAKSV